ncbi:MAG: hypothetical protein ABSE85_05565 [Candidatus Korobacteraceae bacterium]|jgi:uncharacterized membrane protein YphA (DoxX/SURF4 family)
MIPQLQQNTPVSSPDTAPQWSLAARIAFRFGFCYFLLYVYPRSVGSLGALVKYNNPLRDLWHAVVPWVGAHVLHLSGNFTEVANGSGDQLYDYVLLFCIAITALIATVIWSWLDRKRPNYEVLYQWLRIFVRMVVAVAMISYGANKLFRMQFAEPALSRYVDTFGQTTPMGLLWTFMGMSRAYSFFGGVGEMLGGVLLLIPQFAALGSLVTLAVMSNVLMLNLCYDVPRKIYSIHLILFCLFLLFPDMRRIADFFLLNRTTRLTPTVALFREKFLNYGVWALQLGIGVAAIIVCSNQAYIDAANNVTYIQPPALRGIWSVEDYVLDGAPKLPLLTDTDRWQRAIFDAPKKITVQRMDGTFKKYYLEFKSDGKAFNLWDVDNTQWRTTLTYDMPDANHMTLVGKIGGHPATLKLTRENLSDPVKFLLLNRGMHWVTDFAHNR